jgi:hypothetical protein
VDDFGIKYKTPDDAEHLIKCLQLLYEIKVDKTGSRYLGFTNPFDDAQQTVSLSMPDYIPKLLERFFPDQVLRGQPTPAKYEPVIYCSDGQKVKRTDSSPTLTATEKLRLQEIVGAILFYARAVNCTMLTAVNHVASEQQAVPTKRVLQAAERLLEYAAQYPNHQLVYHACDMVLHIQSDASFLSRSSLSSRRGTLPGQQGRSTAGQWWAPPCPQQNHILCYIVSSRSRVWCMLHERTTRGMATYGTRSPRLRATCHAYTV